MTISDGPSVIEGIEWAFSDRDNPRLRILVLRSNNFSLASWVAEALGVLKSDQATFIRSRREITLASGATVVMGLTSDDFDRYRGSEFGKILLERFVHWDRLEKLLILRSHDGRTPQFLIGE